MPKPEDVQFCEGEIQIRPPCSVSHLSRLSWSLRTHQVETRLPRCTRRDGLHADDEVVPSIPKNADSPGIHRLGRHKTHDLEVSRLRVQLLQGVQDNKSARKILGGREHGNESVRECRPVVDMAGCCYFRSAGELIMESLLIIIGRVVLEREKCRRHGGELAASWKRVLVLTET